jgi:hypothetical protein
MIMHAIRSIATLAFAGLVAFGLTGRASGQCEFIRGDIFHDGTDPSTVDFNDGVRIISFLFNYPSEQFPQCYDRYDLNDNGIVEVGDYVYLMQYFEGGPPPKAPYPNPGLDPTPGVVTIPSAPDPRFKFTIGESIGYASNTGLKIPLYISNSVPISGFQMVLEYNGSLLRIDEMLPDDTVLKDHNPDYVIHEAINKPGQTVAHYSALMDFVTPIDFHTLPAGQNQLVGNIVVSISLIADPGEAPLHFLESAQFPGTLPPDQVPLVVNLVTVGSDAFRPQTQDGRVVIRKAFIRGDSNQDKRIDIADTVFMLSYIFMGGRAPTCEDAFDSNNDSRLDISDPIFLLNYLFMGTAQPSHPYPIPGVDPDLDSLGCAI